MLHKRHKQPLPPDSSESWKYFPNSYTLGVTHYFNSTTQHYPVLYYLHKTLSERWPPNSNTNFCTTLFPVSLHPSFSQHKHRRILIPECGYSENKNMTTFFANFKNVLTIRWYFLAPTFLPRCCTASKYSRVSTRSYLSTMTSNLLTSFGFVVYC